MSDLKKRTEAPRIDWIENQQVIRDLDAIGEVLRRQGWIQGMLGRPGGPRCFRGAIYEVIDGTMVPGRSERVMRVINALGFISDGPMVRWQDEPGRTKEEVLERIQKAREML